MKELGVDEAIRKVAAHDKAHIVISEDGGKWTLRSESAASKTSYEFTPGTEFNEKTSDGRDVKVWTYLYLLPILLIIFIRFFKVNNQFWRK